MADKKADNKPGLSIAARAWNATKDANDPEFGGSGESEFWRDLEFRARKVQESGTAITNFEKEVQRLDVEDKKQQAAIGGPMAVVEEPAAITAGATTGPASTPVKKAGSAKAKAAASKTAAKAPAKKPEPTGQRATDTSGHVPDAKEAAAAVKAESTAPKHP